MTQPALGKKLAEIRKQKGITQEDLVTRCNVTVRTIQRIESGEVTPRPSTLKLIFEALEYDWNSLVPEDSKPLENDAPRNWFLRFISFNPAYYADLKLISKELRIACFAGILYFILGFPEAFFEITMMESDFFSGSKSGFIIIKALVLISFVYFIRGFIILGHRQKDKVMLFSAYLYLFVLTIDYSIYMVLVATDAVDFDEMVIGKAIAYGVTAVAFGMGLLRSSQTLGRVAEFAGVLEMVIGVAFLSVILFMVGFVLMIPAEILEIYILFKYSESLKRNDSEPNLSFSDAPREA